MDKTNRREWVKTFAIIFLVILLILTFFSQTIMNYSLPEVSGQSVMSGTLNTKIRASGAVSANETYSVTLNQTRKIQSVRVKVGDSVEAGDLLFILEKGESNELEEAKKALETMELAYQKALINAANETSGDKRKLQKLQEDYNEAQRIYNLYSTADPSQIKYELEKQENYLTAYTDAVDEAKAKVKDIETKMNADITFTAAQTKVTETEKSLADLQADLMVRDKDFSYGIISAIESLTSTNPNYNRITDLKVSISERISKLINLDENDNSGLFEDKDSPVLNKDILDYYLLVTDSSSSEYAKNNNIDAVYKAIINDISRFENTFSLNSNTQYINNDERFIKDFSKLAINIYNDQILRTDYDLLFFDCEELERQSYIIRYWVSDLNAAKSQQEAAEAQLKTQQETVDKLKKASTAGATLETARQAVEDEIFAQQLGNSDSLDLEHQKKEIEKQKELVEKLSENKDGEEITAKVSGTISAVNCTPGTTVSAESPLAEITITDRGYTVVVDVTAEQARQVRVGDQATITNYYRGNLTATLENIANAANQKKKLIFRITGDDVEAGTNLSLSIGQKSANYDCIVPNSAIRSDSNGSFVLLIVAKNTPLGNRYTAARADITVIASDDKSTAVSGLSNGDFVITTASRPIEAGNQIRMVD